MGAGTVRSLGQIAYEAYAEHCNWKSVREESLPDWTDMPNEIKQHWEVAAYAVMEATRG